MFRIDETPSFITIPQVGSECRRPKGRPGGPQFTSINTGNLPREAPPGIIRRII